VTRRTRNWICIVVMAVGLLNFVAYAVGYGVLEGDARNGSVRDGVYRVKGHFLQGPQGKDREVSRGAWIYSYIHSISMWPTQAAVLLAMLTLARPHIIATMRSGWLGGATLVTIVATMIVLVTLTATTVFLIDFIKTLQRVG